jgi:glycosyltransferase involved in cell wall biosynthesis
VRSGPSVSVIVPTLNRRDDMATFCHSLAAQEQRPDELVVVDAGAPTDLEAFLHQVLDPVGIGVVYIRSAKKGTSLQRNLGIDAARGEVLFFFDDDCLLPPDYIAATLRCFAEHPTAPSGRPVGCVMGCFLHPPPTDGPIPRVYALFGLTHYAADDGARLYRSGGVRWSARPSAVIEVPAAYGGATAYLRAALEGERFDQYMPGYCLNEDVELSVRVARRWAILQDPRVVLDHKSSPVSRDGEDERVARYVYALFYFHRLHQPRDASHLLAFAWANGGIVALNLLRGLRPGGPDLPTVARGLGRGYAACGRALRGRPYA